jgi:hypothetical protein
VIIVVDQMRADYVERFRQTWSRGLKRLMDRGAWFTHAKYPYLTTVTCAGHATVATGAFPPAHGVFQNAWYDRTERRLMTCTEDATAEPISYGRGATLSGSLPGESAARLLVPTLADQLRDERGARVAALSLKARSAIMLAGHGGDAVTWLNESLDDWQTSTAFSPGRVPAVDVFSTAIPSTPMSAAGGRDCSRRRCTSIAMRARVKHRPEVGHRPSPTR